MNPRFTCFFLWHTLDSCWEFDWYYSCLVLYIVIRLFMSKYPAWHAVLCMVRNKHAQDSWQLVYFHRVEINIPRYCKWKVVTIKCNLMWYFFTCSFDRMSSTPIASSSTLASPNPPNSFASTSRFDSKRTTTGLIVYMQNPQIRGNNVGFYSRFDEQAKDVNSIRLNPF